MAFFGVTVETVDRVLPHPNAERLELITLRNLGYPLVEGKGRVRPGDRVLYFPIDAVIPAPLAERMGVRKYLAGPDRNQVKTAVLRGESSQGIAASTALLAEVGLGEDSSPEAITAALGVSKFIPPLKEIHGGRLVPLPDGVSVYDIEAVERSQAAFEWLLDRDVVITEKLEGQNAGVHHDRLRESLSFAMREQAIVMDEGCPNLYVDTARAEGMDDFARWLTSRGYTRAVVYAELLGPALSVGNYYGLPANRMLVFDIRADGKWLPWDTLVSLLAGFHADTGRIIGHVPLVFRGRLRDFLAGRSLREAAHGPSALVPSLLREGLVVKDALEELMPTSFNRVIIKQRDPIYLAKTGN